MITHEEIRKLLNTTEIGESPTRLYERKLKIHDYINQQETLQAKLTTMLSTSLKSETYKSVSDYALDLVDCMV